MSSRRITLRKRVPEPVPEPTAPAAAASPASGKGRPTPKRSEAQKRRGGPVPPPPTTRREAAARLRAQGREDRADLRRGTTSGDPDRMLPRDAGPVRALVRDVIDARRNTAVLLLPVALLLVVAELSDQAVLVAVAGRLWAATLLAVLVDVFLTVRAVRRALTAAHPDVRLRSHIGYGLLRSTVVRRFRMPPPRTSPPPLLRQR